MHNLDKLKVSWLITAILSLCVAIIGVINQTIYDDVVTETIFPGVISQDLITICAAFIVIILSLRIKQEDFKQQLVVLGIFGYLSYAYGIYVIEQLYNLLYPVYMAILTLSCLNILYGVGNIDRDFISNLKIPSVTIKRASIGFMLLNVVMFYPLWLSQLLPLLQTGNRIEHLFSIFIIDLCFIMPAFLIISIKVMNDDGLGLLLAPIMFIVGIAILFPLAVGELLRPILIDQAIRIEEMTLFLVLSAIFFILDFFYLKELTLNE